MTSRTATATSDTETAAQTPEDVINALELAIHTLRKVDVSVDEGKHVWNGLVAGIANLPDRTTEEIDAIMQDGWKPTKVELPAPPVVEPPEAAQLPSGPGTGVGTGPSKPDQTLPGAGPKPDHTLPESPAARRR